MEYNNSIDCNVHDCKHCNCDCNKCKLECIKVCNCGIGESKENTMCSSFKKK